MSIVINLHLKAKEDQYDTLHGVLTAILPDTAAREGAELISCMADPENKGSIRSGIETLHRSWVSSGLDDLSPDPSLAEMVSPEAVTNDLIQAIESVLPGR